MMKDQETIAKKLVQADPRTKAELDAFKRKICAEFKIPYPSNIDLLSALNDFDGGKIKSSRQELRNLLRVRPVRSLSGIINVSVLTKPYPCPGSCLYCPQETGFPKSYLSGEPAAERAKRLNFDPVKQVAGRLGMLAEEGHPVDKIEMRIIGGTWSFYKKAYRESFVKKCFFACNNYGSKNPKRIGSLKQEQKINESAKCRIIGLSVETRPDFIDAKEIISLRNLGITKVELGIQSIYNDVLDLNQRGHKVDSTVKATHLLKNAGFKIAYQIMLNLYGSSPQKDLNMVKTLFNDERFQPDTLKIYPCAVLPEAPLYKIYKQGSFKPYSDKKLTEVIKEIKKIIPPYVRIERIIRDIPSPRITEGAKTVSNLRQIIAADMAKENWQCQCIRCREVKGGYDPNEKVFPVRRTYSASGGQEIFLSFENKDQTKIFSLLRLRVSQNPELVIPALKNAALIREIHTYGFQLAVAEKASAVRHNGETRLVAVQHQGLGKKLILEAEKIVKKEFGFKNIAAISGVGARAYWRKSGYALKETYMIKKL
ncbi:MAG TPA: tRNA uridine(34) 5-carboxymethylaminomethyl modification radical SAM/GNAT enzyme Elp3 [Candidatus Paceibacterota bacterium]|nr:tRNA uridine(34) 5-carboxymethylaminomethyl modification radical SAM/GNAT enzyme Elp3 [Candidatus Pacearchaeota archaeon]HRZ50754.1 tRNA uridine(34) 5-carboxymethylaminomethyl modification radical SAM/GNAT enzyme Elp3 [Candidatus Paceibacterota bacterium]HSA36349.1 tRNA uridine(34) 5-carboxymethylaminomethyl modification radical SAM/GNAT enzyme Elp3 [Candidatus Paceibacterota bacterium]